jgi:DNA-binding IclR family transcriptional regulator
MNANDRIATNLRTLLILEVLGKNNRAMTATEINASLRLPKQTVHRLCATLEKENFLTRQGNSKRYLPARRLRDLGAGLLYTSRDHITRRQILKQVAEQVGETVNFAVPEDNGMSYIDRVETDWAFRIQLPIGTNVPFHCTASGKCFLSSLSKRETNGILSSLKLDALTDKTHVTVDALLKELSEIKRQGYALDREEFMEGMIAIAVPIKDKENRFVGALAFHGPTQRISIKNAVERKDTLLNASQKLQEHLF